MRQELIDIRLRKGDDRDMINALFIFMLAVSLTSACSSTSTLSSTAEDQAATPAPASSPAEQAQSPASALQPPASVSSATTPTSPAASQTSAPSATSAPPAAEPAPAATHVREITIPADTLLTVSLETPMASDTSHVEDPISGTLTKPIVVGGRTVVPAGAAVSGSVVAAKESGRVKGRASIAFAFDRLSLHGEGYRIRTARVTRVAPSSKNDDVKKGGIGAAAGAIIGGIAGGGKGAAIGAGAGATGTVLATKGREIRLAAGTRVSTRLREPVKIVVPDAE